jgi:hypothetical protein
LRDFTGDVLNNTKVHVVDYDGRLYLAHTAERYDVIDLSLADSAGLSSPGGFAIVEKYSYTREAMTSYMRALRDGGILSVTMWNKEEPPKSVLKLYATMVDAARMAGAADVARSFFVFANYLSTATVLYKDGGLTDAEVTKLRDHTAAMSFDEIYGPGAADALPDAGALLAAYREQIFGAAGQPSGLAPPPADPGTDTGTLPATSLGRLVWRHLVSGDWPQFAGRYVFDVRPLTDDRPYFAGYVKPGDLPRALDRLDVLQDEWGYLLLWATLAVAGREPSFWLHFQRRSAGARWCRANPEPSERSSISHAWASAISRWKWGCCPSSCWRWATTRSRRRSWCPGCWCYLGSAA